MDKQFKLFQAMKLLLLCACQVVAFISFAAENLPKNNVTVIVHKDGNAFHIEASYPTRLNACNAFAFITDYEDAKNIPGIMESKVISRTDNKVIVERQVKETILLFPLEISSTIQYTELPLLGLNFEQIRGDNKIYKGTWRLASNGDATTFTYKSLLELNSVVPNHILEYFVRHSIKKRFESMEARAALKENTNSPKCH
jgi:hypothetical protein